MSADVTAQQDWTAVFAEVLSQPESRVQAEIWAQVFGEEYPAELAPYSYTSRSELRRIAEEVRVGAGELLVDIGSGRGGPGLWVAATTGADYCAVDIAEPGLARCAGGRPRFDWTAARARPSAASRRCPSRRARRPRS